MFRLLAGNNTFDSYIKLNKIKKEFSLLDFEVRVVDADELDTKELNNELDFSDGLFAKKRLLILKRLAQNTSQIIENFCNFVLNNIDNENVNIVLWEDEMIGKKSKLNEITKFFTIELFEDVKDYQKRSEAQKFTTTLSKSFNLEFDYEKIDKFLDLVGYEKFDIYFELKKLAILKRNNLSPDFQSLTKNENYNIFEFVSLFWGKDYEHFLKVLNFIMLDKQIYSLILSLIVNKLISKSETIILKKLAKFDFEFKSGNLEEEDVFILLYNQINN